VDGDHVVLKINGQIVNEGTGAEVVPGKICLQSEGAEIHFRRIMPTRPCPQIINLIRMVNLKRFLTQIRHEPVDC
jgi:hypothetical protein